MSEMMETTLEGDGGQELPGVPPTPAWWSLAACRSGSRGDDWRQ